MPLLTLIEIPAMFGLVKGFGLLHQNQQCPGSGPDQGPPTNNRAEIADWTSVRADWPSG